MTLDVSSLRVVDHINVLGYVRLSHRTWDWQSSTQFVNVLIFHSLCVISLVTRLISCTLCWCLGNRSFALSFAAADAAAFGVATS